MYIQRAAEKQFMRMNAFFKAVLVTGARQVGKTTMLKHLAESQQRTYVSMDDTDVRALARTDPKMFFMRFKPPIIIDEVQYAPELFPYIKVMCDNTDERGLFWLTGSQQYSMMKNVIESLAGRVGIMNLYPLSFNEVNGVTFDKPLAFSLDDITKRQSRVSPTDLITVFDFIRKGGMPQAFDATDEQRALYYNAYIDSYLMRDATETGGITDYVKFRKFLTACAANVSQMLNVSSLAQIAEVSHNTANSWLKVLVGLHVVYLLQPYSSNRFKRLAKTPKLYYWDTGLCAHLTKWLTTETLVAGNQAGGYFENFVVTELIKSFDYSSFNYALTYFRDSNDKEVDLFLEYDGEIHPIEIKLSSMPDRRIVKNFAVLDKNDIKRGNGGVICMCETPLPIDEENFFIPCNLI